MKLKLIPVVALGTTLFTASVSAAADTPGAIDFGTFTPSGGSQFVEVDIKSNLINMVARLVEKEDADVAKLLRNIKAVRVNVIGLNDGNRAEIKERIGSIRSQLANSNWERIVTAMEQDQDVGVFIKLRGEEAVEGVAVTVINGDREAVFVNVVGDIRPDQIAQVGESLNIKPLKELGHQIEDHK